MGSKRILRIAHIKDGTGPWVSDHPEVQSIINNTKLPIPAEDKGFNEAALGRLNDVKASPVKFGFKDETQMKRTFSDDDLAKFKQHGYEPQWQDVKDVWHGNTQSFFTTHEGDKKHVESQDRLKQNTKFKQYSPEEIAQMNVKKTLRERWEELKKGMNNAGLGGKGSVKAGAVLPSINNKVPKPGNNSLAGKVGIPSVAPKSKKNPLKQAQQIHSKDIKDIRMKEAQSKLKSDMPEVIKFDANGQWSLQKDSVNPDLAPKEVKIKQLQQQIDAGTYKPDASKIADAMIKPKKDSVDKSDYGPKKMDLYNQADNEKRKASRTSEVIENIGPNKAVREYTSAKGGTAKQQASAEAAKYNKKNKKQPVKTIEDIDPEVLQQLKAKYETGNRSKN